MGGGNGYNFQGDPNEFFAHFTRSNNQRQRSYGESPFEGSGGLEEMLFGMKMQQQQQRSHVPERIYNVSCTLEELYNGKVRKMKITRKSLTPNRPTTKVLEVPIRPGFKAGTRITYSGEGDEIEPGRAEDIVFIVCQQQHTRFVREGDDLHYEIKIPLVDALTGFTHDICMLDEPKQRFKRLNQKVPVSNLTTKIIPGEGMPRRSNKKSPPPSESSKGDLIINFVVEFPTEALSDEQKEHIRKALV